MENKRVFIGWNGNDNRDIARKVSNALSSANYHPIVGGEWRASLTVSEEIIQQMNVCDFAIFLIEKEVRKKDDGELVSMGFNPNVMMELGYMLHRVSDPNRIRRILINMEPSELPSDLQGAWSLALKKENYDPSDEDARDAALSFVAKKIVEDFYECIKAVRSLTDKLDYFDNWDENVLDIYKNAGETRISEKLIYGMQASIYSGDYERLYQKLLRIRDQLAVKDRFNDYSSVACAIAVLDVFIVTKRLTQNPTEQQFCDLCAALDREYEKDVDNEDLAIWCKIFRLDKKELCCELFAASQEDPEDKIDYLYEALELCHKIVSMIDDHIQGSENDEVKNKDAKYALLYKAFLHRNVSQIHKRLAALEPDSEEEHVEEQKKYCAMTLKHRKELFDHYNGGIRENTLSMDFISQEYLLSLAEYHQFVEKRIERKRIEQTIRSIYNKWKEHNVVRNMILRKVETTVHEFLD